MASVHVRGPRAAPRYHARYKDVDGVWKSKRVRVDLRADALKIARQLEARAERIRYGLEAPERPLMGKVLTDWSLTLQNRSWRDDLGRLRLHVMPKWSEVKIDDVTSPAILTWIEEMRSDASSAPGTQRHALNILSRVFGWAVTKGLCTVNPVRALPQGVRTRVERQAIKAWIADGETLIRVMALLPNPFDLAFYVAFTSGCRMGEAFGLHLDDFDELATTGRIRVARSFDGPLKEDKHDSGKMKFPVVREDAEQVLGPWLARRRAAGAGPEDFAFPGADGKVMKRYVVSYQWRKAMKVLGLDAGWQQASRDSFKKRNGLNGVAAPQIAAAMGSPVSTITQKGLESSSKSPLDWRLRFAPGFHSAG